MMKFYNKNALWGFFIIIPFAFFFLFTPITAFAEGENPPQTSSGTEQNESGRGNHSRDKQNKDGKEEKSKKSEKRDDNEPVTHKEFNEFKNQYAKESADKINKADAEKLIKEKTPDEDFLNLILACSAVTLVMAVAGLICGVKVNGGLERSINRNREKDAQIKKLQSEIEDLKQRLSKLASQKESVQTVYIQPKTETPKVEEKKAVVIPPNNAPVNPVAEFLEEYYKLNNMDTNYESKEFRKKFFNKYHLRAFSCVNSDERAQIPRPSPVYGYEDPIKASLWAYQIDDNRFVVVPKIPQIYDSNIHIPGAMCEIFDSNFENGRIYNKIEVLKPAIFTEGLGLVSKGQLKLS